MKDVLNKRFWIFFLTINAAFIMGFIAFSYLNYSLLLGHLFGLCVLIIYVLCIDSIIKNIFIEIKDINKKHKKRVGILYLFLVNIFILSLILGIFMINYLYKKHSDTKTLIAFFPVNFIVFVIPFLIFLISSLLEYGMLRKFKSNLNKNKKE